MGKKRHIIIRHEFVKQLIVNEVITMGYIKSKRNIVDPFTKG